MFPVCAGIEIFGERGSHLVRMFPVCAGIEIWDGPKDKQAQMFPVCAGIENWKYQKMPSSGNVSRVCGN